MLLWIVAVGLAGPYDDVLSQAEQDQRLYPGDSSVLLGMVGEEACAWDDDPEACAAVRIPPACDNPLLQLIPVGAWLLPPLGGRTASLLLPQLPYGSDEPACPVLGEARPGAQRLFVRLPLPGLPSTASSGPAQVLLLASAQAMPTSAADPHHPNLLPITPSAAQIDVQDGSTLQVSWTGGEEAPLVALLPQPVQDQLSERLALVSGICARDALGRHTVRRGLRFWRPPPRPQLAGEPYLVLAFDEGGEVDAATLSGQPWEDPDLDRCLGFNARLLQLDTRTHAPTSIAMVKLSVTAGSED